MSPRQTNFLRGNVKQHVCCKIFPSMSVTYKGSLNSLPCHLLTERGREGVHSYSTWILCPLFLYWIYSLNLFINSSLALCYIQEILALSLETNWKKKKKTRDEMPIALSPKDRLIPFLRGAGTKDTASISLSWWFGSSLVVSDIIDPSESSRISLEGR